MLTGTYTTFRLGNISECFYFRTPLGSLSSCDLQVQKGVNARIFMDKGVNSRISVVKGVNARISVVNGVNARIFVVAVPDSTSRCSKSKRGKCRSHLSRRIQGMPPLQSEEGTATWRCPTRNSRTISPRISWCTFFSSPPTHCAHRRPAQIFNTSQY